MEVGTIKVSRLGRNWKKYCKSIPHLLRLNLSFIYVSFSNDCTSFSSKLFNKVDYTLLLTVIIPTIHCSFFRSTVKSAFSMLFLSGFIFHWFTVQIELLSSDCLHVAALPPSIPLNPLFLSSSPPSLLLSPSILHHPFFLISKSCGPTVHLFFHPCGHLALPKEDSVKVTFFLCQSYKFKAKECKLSKTLTSKM